MSHGMTKSGEGIRGIPCSQAALVLLRLLLAGFVSLGALFLFLLKVCATIS